CPPALMRTVWRIVWFSNDGVAGKGPRTPTGGSGAAPHVCTHSVPVALAPAVAAVAVPTAEHRLRATPSAANPLQVVLFVLISSAPVKTSLIVQGNSAGPACRNTPDRSGRTHC